MRLPGRNQPLTRKLLAESNGPVALGALLDLGETQPHPQPPEVEDHLFRPECARLIGRVSPDRYIELLSKHARRRLAAIFGEELMRHGWNYAVEKGHGEASLGILRVRRKPRLEVDRYGKLRLRMSDGKAKPAYLPVTDLRFVEPDHVTIRRGVIAGVQGRIDRGVELLLMLGLSRAFRKPDDTLERHWLQVNGLCLLDRPLDDRP